jgi:beta-lactamase class A
VRNLCLVAILASTPTRAAHPQVTGLEAELRARIRTDTAVVAIAYIDPVMQDTLLINGLRRFHAASTMKVPVLIELGQRIDRGELQWSTPIPVQNRFRSIVDSSEFQLNPTDDSDSTLYCLEGRSASVDSLAHLMIARSSNLATNLLIERLDPARVDATAHRLGADSIAVLRGVEDDKAYRVGRNNTTTARDLARLLDALATGRAASDSTSRRMLGFLLAQEFNDGIPARLPPQVKVAHKTGEITAIAHDAAIVYPPARGPFVLVILTQGYADRSEAARVMADLAALVYRWAIRKPDPHE